MFKHRFQSCRAAYTVVCTHSTASCAACSVTQNYAIANVDASCASIFVAPVHVPATATCARWLRAHVCAVVGRASRDRW